MIYKGCQKKTVLIRNPGGKYFEQAYLIMKDDYDDEPPLDDIINEANRIVERCIAGKHKKLSRVSSYLLFLLGMAISAFIYTLVLLFIG